MPQNTLDDRVNIGSGSGLVTDPFTWANVEPDDGGRIFSQG